MLKLGTFDRFNERGGRYGTLLFSHRKYEIYGTADRKEAWGRDLGSAGKDPDKRLTAIPFDIVRVGEQYGTVFELLDATSSVDYIGEAHENLEDFIRQSVELMKRDLEELRGS